MTTNSVQTKDSSTLDLAAIRAEMAALTEQVASLVGAAGKDGAAMVRRALVIGLGALIAFFVRR